MKKSIALLGIATFAVLLATGCGGKTKLVCTQKQSGVDIEFNVGFNGNKVESLDFNYDMDLSKYSDSQIKLIEKRDFCSLVKLSMSGYKDAFTGCKQNVVKKHLKVVSKLDIDKIAKSEKDKLTSADEAKKALEKQGYKCVKK